VHEKIDAYIMIHDYADRFNDTNTQIPTRGRRCRRGPCSVVACCYLFIIAAFEFVLSFTFMSSRNNSLSSGQMNESQEQMPEPCLSIYCVVEIQGRGTVHVHVTHLK
jgi:hypothetical protein